MNIIEIMRRFPTEEACRDYLVSLRWPDGVRCPKCGCDRISELKSRKQYTCLECRHRFSPTSGTVMHSTKLPLQKWLLAIYMLADAKKSISSHQLARQLDISIKRAWHLTHRIREAMREDYAQAGLFSGIVQMDDYFYGGKARPEEKGTLKRGRGSQKQQPVLGAYENNTRRIRTAVVPNTRQQTIANTAGPWIERPNAALHTDCYAGYNLLGSECTPHKKVNHDAEYVTSDGVHVNGVENAWSLLSRAMMGSFHHVSRKHLHRYLSEFDSRFNARKRGTTNYLEAIVGQADGRRLSMDMLVGREAAQEEETA